MLKEQPTMSRSRRRVGVPISHLPPPELVRLVKDNAIAPLLENLKDSFRHFKCPDDKCLADYIDYAHKDEYAEFMSFLKRLFSAENLHYYTKFKKLLDTTKYDLFVRGLHDIMSDEKVRIHLNFPNGAFIELRRAVSIHWDIQHRRERPLDEVRKLTPAPKEVQTCIANAKKAIREHMEESFHRFQVIQAPIEISAKDAFDPIVDPGTQETYAMAVERIENVFTIARAIRNFAIVSLL